MDIWRTKYKREIRLLKFGSSTRHLIPQFLHSIVQREIDRSAFFDVFVSTRAPPHRKHGKPPLRRQVPESENSSSSNSPTTHLLSNFFIKLRHIFLALCSAVFVRFNSTTSSTSAAFATADNDVYSGRPHRAPITSFDASLDRNADFTYAPSAGVAGDPFGVGIPSHTKTPLHQRCHHCTKQLPTATATATTPVMAR
jgi:hypothetical protein